MEGAASQACGPVRVYLDTADLVTIADGKDEAGAVAELFAQCERLSAVLIFSMWHVVDLRNAEIDSKDRVLAAIDQFPRRALARLKGRGIELWPDPQIRDMVVAEPELIEGIEQAGNYVMQLERSIPQPPAATPEWLVNFAKKLVNDASHCKSEEDAVLLAARMVHRERRRFPAELVQGVLAAAREGWAIRSRMAQLQTNIPLLDKAMKRRAAALLDKDDDANVGREVSALVDERRRRQRKRSVQDGDIPDRGHVELAPFVDVFTGDRDICAWLVEWRTKFRYARNVAPFRSRHLHDVVAWLAGLPT